MEVFYVLYRRFTLLINWEGFEELSWRSVLETHTHYITTSGQSQTLPDLQLLSACRHHVLLHQIQSMVKSTRMVYWVKCNGYVECDGLWVFSECFIGCYGARETGFRGFNLRKVCSAGVSWMRSDAVNAVNQAFISGHYSFYYWLLLWCL